MTRKAFVILNIKNLRRREGHRSFEVYHFSNDIYNLLNKRCMIQEPKQSFDAGNKSCEMLIKKDPPRKLITDTEKSPLFTSPNRSTWDCCLYWRTRNKFGRNGLFQFGHHLLLLMWHLFSGSADLKHILLYNLCLPIYVLLLKIRQP